MGSNPTGHPKQGRSKIVEGRSRSCRRVSASKMANSKDLKDRTKTFAVSIIRMIDKLPRSIASDVIARQLIRSATSVAANYRAAQRGRSKAEFIAKLQIVLEESDETQYWLELLLELEALDRQILRDSIQEADELTAIFVSALKTARSK